MIAVNPGATPLTLAEILSQPASSRQALEVVASLAYYRAMLGRDPDQPQHLTRVVVLSGESLVGRGD